MIRFTTAAGAVIALLALAGCGHQQPAPSQESATLAGFVTSTSTAPSPAPAPAPDASSACARGKDAYGVLVYLVSADTGTSVPQIASDLRSGRSLDDAAGADASQVRAQALDLVQSWLQFAQANGKLTAAEARQYRDVAPALIAGLMAADVASCVPAG